MANLLQNVQSSLQSTGPTGTPSGMATEQALQLSRAATGKAVQPGQGPKVDATLERAAAVQGQQAQRQVAQQAQAQQVAMQAQEQQQKEAFRLQIRSQTERKTAVKEEAIQKVQSILDSYEKRGIEFDLTRQEAEVEQTKFLIRLQDDQYIQQLQMVSARERLDNEFVFNVALAESVFGEYYNLMLDNVSFQKLLNEDKRSFERDIDLMKVDHKLWQERLEFTTANSRARAQGASQAVSAAAKGTTEVYIQNQKRQGTAVGDDE